MLLGGLYTFLSLMYGRLLLEEHHLKYNHSSEVFNGVFLSSIRTRSVIS